MNNFFSLCAVLCFSVSASADGTTVSQASSTGYRGMGASKSNSTRFVSGLKSR